MNRRRGQILLLFALLMPVIATGATLAMDTGYWMIQKRQVQYAADAAAMVGAQSINESTTSKSTTVVNKVEAWLQQNIVFPSGVTGCQEDLANPTPAQFCAINQAPQSAPYNDSTSSVYSRRFHFVEVIINTRAQSLFYTMFNGLGFGTFFSEPTIRARAVAGGVQPITYAILTMDSSTGGNCSTDPMGFCGGGGGATINGNVCSNGDIGVGGDNITVNGSAASGGSIGPSSLNNATSVVPDTDPACGTPPCDFTGYPLWDSNHTETWTIQAGSDNDGQPAVPIGPGDPDPLTGDPIGSLEIKSNAPGAPSVTLRPGGWNSITISKSSATVTLQPGVYYVEADFKLERGTVLASGTVTFVVKGNFIVSPSGNMGSEISRVSAKGDTYVTCNILIYLLPPTPDTNKVEFSTNGAVYLAGTIYAPSANSSVTTGGAGGIALNLEGQILASKFQLSGTGTTITYDYSNSAYIPAPYLAE